MSAEIEPNQPKMDPVASDRRTLRDRVIVVRDPFSDEAIRTGRMFVLKEVVLRGTMRTSAQALIDASRTRREPGCVE